MRRSQADGGVGLRLLLMLRLGGQQVRQRVGFENPCKINRLQVNKWGAIRPALAQGARRIARAAGRLVRG